MDLEDKVEVDSGVAVGWVDSLEENRTVDRRIEADHIVVDNFMQVFELVYMVLLLEEVLVEDTVNYIKINERILAVMD